MLDYRTFFLKALEPLHVASPTQGELKLAFWHLATSVEVLLDKLCMSVFGEEVHRLGFEAKLDSLAVGNVIPHQFLSHSWALADFKASTVGERNSAYVLSSEELKSFIVEVRSLLHWYMTVCANGPKMMPLAANSELAQMFGFHTGTRPAPPLKIFLSYGKEDVEVVRGIYERLVLRGEDPWLDEFDLIGGQDWEAEIRRAVKAADVFIAFLSYTSVNRRGFFYREIRFGLDVILELPPQSIFFLPVKLGQCEVPDDIKRFQWIEYTRSDFFVRLFNAMDTVRRMMGSGIGVKVIAGTTPNPTNAADA